MADAQILVAVNGTIAQIKVAGRATHAVSKGLKDFALELGSLKIENVFIDLAECTGMDSTFMGVLTQIGLPMFKADTPVLILNASDSNVKLLTDLGLSKIFLFDSNVGEFNWLALKQLSTKKLSNQEKGEMMLESHEILSDIDDANVPKFKDVIAFLKDDLETYKEKKD
ncbi:MAG: STAS domain-containing protein [Lentisphaeria bacterium]|nr:STAS domain-containing protein [Lentisphaeria bacterium]NQZ67880.1 STAS domain-containing protein [Lentisphaeria bacterium]